MSDVNSNININFNTADALAQLRKLQAGLSKFHQSLAEGNLAAANAQKGLNAQLVQAIGSSGKFAVSQAKVASSTLAFTTALEKNKLSLREYYRYSMAAATANTKVLTKAFAQEREIINRARRDRVKALQAQYIQMAKAQGGFIDAMRVMPRTLQMANGRFTELGTRIQYAAQRQQFLNQLLKQGSTSLLNFGKNTQWAGRQLMVGLTMPLMMLGGYASKAFRDLEKATVKFRRVYGDAFTNDAEVEAAVQNIKKLANEYTKYGVAVKDTMDMASTAAAAGFQGEALNQQVKTATKLAVLGQIEQQQALETTISLQNAFGISSEELAKKIDFLNAVENQTVLSIEDLTVAIPKAAPVVKQLGGSVEDLAFFLTAMKEGGINASEGANALKSGLASMINPTKKASAMLASMGINITGIVEATKGDIKRTVVEFAKALDTLDPLNRARAIEQMFGKFQFARLSTLFQNVSKDGSQASRALDLAGASVESLAILSEREMKKVEDAVGTKFQAAVEQFKQDIMPLGKAFLEAVTPIVGFFGKLFEKFNGLGDKTKKVIAIIVGVVAGLGPVLLMTFGLLANGLANLVKLFATIRGGIAKLNGQTNILGGGFNYLTQEQLEQQAAGQALHNTHTRLVEVFNVEKTAAMQLASAYNMLASQMRNMASQNPALFAGGLSGAKSAISKLPKGYADGVISVPGPKGAGDVVPAMVSPGEAIIPTKTAEKHRGLITAMFQDKVPGFMAGKLPGTMHPAPSRVVNLKGPKPFAETQAERLIAEKISESANSGRFAKMKPTEFGTLLHPNTGRSFPVPGVGGIYKQKNGQVVVVKPTMDETTAMAEIRANDLTRLHDLSTPKMTVKKMIDPTDPSGKRSYLVLVSKYNKNFSPEGMTGTFTKKQMIKQLVASTIRGDRDLQQSNVSGRNAPDASNAYIFAKGSGFRGIAQGMPSMEEMALINTLGVKGGAKKFFAQATAGQASKMTAQEYQDAIVSEINRVIPLYKKEILQGRNFKNLRPEEQLAYNDVISRLEAGRNADWKAIHAAHVRAGGQTPKYINGLGGSATERAMRDELAKFIIGDSKTQVHLSRELRQSLEKTLGEKVNELSKTDPQRAQMIRDAWKGGTKGFAASRQSQFIGEIAKMHAVKDPVSGQILYVHKDDYSNFISDPIKNIKYARSRAEIEEKLLYRMGATKRDGNYVSKGKFAGRFAKIGHFVTDLKYTGKASGGGRSSLLPHVREVADEQIRAYNKQLGLDSTKYKPTDLEKQAILNSQAGKTLKGVGFSNDEIISKLKPELSHIQSTGRQGIGGRDTAAKFQSEGSFARYDANIINRYMWKGTPRFLRLLDWAEKQLAANKPSPYTAEQIKLLKPSAHFMSVGQHPVNEIERRMVAQAAEMDIKMNSWLKASGVAKPTGYSLPKDIRNAMGVSALIGDTGSKFLQPSQIMHLGAKNKGVVLADAEKEYMYNAKTNTYEKISGPQPGSAVAIPNNGSRRDTTLVKETPTRTVANAKQVQKLGATPVKVMARENASQTNKFLTLQREKVLRSRGYSEEQIAAALKSQAKNDKKVADAKATAAKNTINAEKKAEIARKDQAYRARQSAILQTKINAAHEEALKMNQKFDKDARKEKIKQARVARSERIGRFSGGASMALGTAGMAAMMSGNEKGGMALMGASAVAGMAPMLSNPIGAVAAGLMTLAGTVIAFNMAMKKAREEGIALGNAMSMTNAKLIALSEITKTVSATEEANRKRADRLTGATEKQRKVGQTILDSEFGKSLLADIQTQAKAGMSSTEVGKNIGVQLSSAMMSGVINSEQARTLAMAIGNQLKDYPMSANIVGEIIQITGPNGENLKNEPLKVAMTIDQKTFASSQKMVDFAAKQTFAKSFLQGTQADATAALEGKKGLGHQVMASINPYIYQDFFDPKKSGLDKTMSILTFGMTSAFFQIRDANAQTNKIRTAGAQLMIQELQNNQQLVDSLNKQYDIKAKTAKNEKELQVIEDERKKALADLNKQNQEQLDTILKSKDKLGDTAWNAAIKGAADALYKEGPMAEMKNVALDQLNALQNTSFKTEMQLEFASGLIDPMTLVELINNPDFQTSWNILVNTTLGGNAAEASVLSQLMSKAGLKTETKKIVIDLLNNQGDKYTNEDITTAIDTLSKIQETYGITLDVNVNNEAKVKRIADMVNALKGRQNVTKLELEAMAKEDPRYKYIVDNWKTLVGDGSTITRTMLLNIETMVTDEKILDAYLQAAGTPSDRATVAGVRQGSIPSIAADSIRQKASVYFAQNPSKLSAALGIPGGNTTQDTGTKVDPYEFLLTRLKNVRNAAINAAGGINELNKALAASGSKSVKDRFIGIEEQLTKKGYSRQFTDWLTGMDPKEQAKWMKTATKTITKGKNKGRVINPYTGKMMDKGAKVGDVVLAPNAEKMAKGFDAAIVGDFNNAATKSLTILKEQETTRRKLAALGYDSTAIERILQDEYTTSAIANGKITDTELKTNAVLNNQVVLREKINNLISNGLQAQQKAANVKQIPKVLEFFAKMSSQGINLSSGAMLDMIGDPEQLAAAIAAMNDYETNAAGARDRLKEIVDGLNAIKANSNIQLVMDFVSKNTAGKAQAGFEAAKRVMEVRKNVYSNMKVGELPGINTAQGKNIGATAVSNVAARYKAAGMAIPTVGANESLKSIQTKRAQNAKVLQLAQQQQSQLQNTVSAAQDAVSAAQDNLENAIDNENKRLDGLIKDEENKISSIEKQIKLNYEDKIDAFNKESDKLNNDLAIMDHAAQQINDKYDKQVEALQKVADINSDIAASQEQQLGLADALSQGDIAAAAKAAQDMRASQQENMLNAQMSSLEQARQNELNSLRGKESGLTRDQISERQYEISQAIYALETDPERLKLEKQIEEIKANIAKIEEGREASVKAAALAAQQALDAAKATLDTANKNLTAQNAIVKTYQDEEDNLASQETYMQSIVDEATDLDDSTGMTLEKWQETVDKLTDVEQLAKDYAISLAAAEKSAAAADGSWASILESINAIPESVETKSIITEIRNITENITRYVNTVNTGSSGGSTGSTGSTSTSSTSTAAADALRKLQSSGVDSLTDAERALLGLPSKSASADAAAKAKADAEAAAAAKAKADAEAAAEALRKAQEAWLERRTGGDMFASSGGLVKTKYFARGGYSLGTDTVPAMLTPGEFVMSRYAVNSHGLDTMKAINSGESVGDSVYNYSINVNVKSDANPDEIARAVMAQIKQVDSKKLRGARL